MGPEKSFQTTEIPAMPCFLKSKSHTRSQAMSTALLAMVVTSFITPGALALITGGEGNRPLKDPGWPKGAAAIFNTQNRIAWWEGPPYGGGQWHSECRGDARALGEILAGFATLEVKNKRVILHDGVGASFWLNMNCEPAKLAAARMDWVLMVWQPNNWERLHRLPADLNPTDRDDAGKGPPAQIDVFTGGNIRWTDVTLPKGLEIIDQRLEAHGFSTADGIVLEGKILDFQAGRPLAGKVSLELIEPRKEGGYRHTAKASAAADAQGRWVLKHAPAGWFRIVVAADGFVPKIVAYERFGEEPRWQDYQCFLSRPAPVSGRVTDDLGQPLEGASVQFHNVAAVNGARYESTASYSFKTDAQGRFNADTLPFGTATIWVNKSGYCRPGLGLSIKIPATDVALTMSKSARIIITVEFAGAARSGDYIVEMLPEGGAVVGSWGGSSSIDAANQVMFRDVPPGRYVIRGRPNPSSANQASKPLVIELKSGQASRITLPAS
jgi:hypothetical protein